MNQETSFGIILPTFNRSTLLERALLSIINQSYENWIVCIVDDGSTDNTAEMIKSYLKDARVHYIQQAENLGVNAARNAALEYLITQRQCDFITLLDDDDYFNTETFTQAHKHIQEIPNQSWFVSSKVDESGKSITTASHYSLIDYVEYHLGITMQGDATHFMKSTFIGNTRFSKQFKQAQEWIFFMALSAQSKMYYYDFPSTICQYLEDGLSAQVQQKKKAKSTQDIAVEQLEQEMLKALGYSHTKVEILKLKYRITKVLETKRYIKLTRYIPKYLYWKFLAVFE